MDNSLNMVDLEYFTSSQMHEKLFHVIAPETSKSNSSNNYMKSSEFVFYRKRILQLVKDIIKGEKVNDNLIDSFTNFSKNAIQHFSFVDKADIIQQQHDLEEQERINTQSNSHPMRLPPIHESEEKRFGNQLLYKEKVAPLTKKIDDFVVRKSEKIQTHIIPKQREYDLKDEHLRYKGVQMNKIVDPHRKKQKKEKKVKKDKSTNQKQQHKEKKKKKNMDK